MPTGRASIRRWTAVGLVVVMGVTGCSDDGEATGADPTSTTAPATSAPAAPPTRPDGPAAELVEITGERAPFVGEAAPPDLAGVGYVETEFSASGTATSYRPVGELAGDGAWELEPADEAGYRTRVLVRRPADPDRFSGTVVVEWLNVSAGLDGNPDWTSLEAEVVRRGHAWVGVSAQRIGVEGGPVLVAPSSSEGLAGQGLVRLDPTRYGSLRHPGDGFAFDIYTQVARALRDGSPALSGRPDVVLAVGESQSAIALVTYHNGVQPLTAAFDGFLIHSRASVALPLVGPGESADLAAGFAHVPTLLRTDLDVPTLTLQTEGDLTSVMGSVRVRQPDTGSLRLWEVAGAAHADAFLLGPHAAALDCGAPVNDAPMHLVAKAALHALDRWVRTGDAPPEAPRIEVTRGDAPEIQRDGDGIALGGIRTPPVDVPVDVPSGVPGPNPDLLCILVGSTLPLPPERVAELHASREDYERAYEAAVDAAIEAGYVLEDDRGALRQHAKPDRVGL